MVWALVHPWCGFWCTHPGRWCTHARRNTSIARDSVSLLRRLTRDPLLRLLPKSTILSPLEIYPSSHRTPNPHPRTLQPRHFCIQQISQEQMIIVPISWSKSWSLSALTPLLLVRATIKQASLNELLPLLHSLQSDSWSRLCP